MSDLYYGSAEEAAGDLGLPLLLAASPAAAVPRHGVRLSEFAPDVHEGSRLFHRLPLDPGALTPRIWITGPNGTTEYAVWGVGLAEHAARSGMAAYLVDLDPAHPLGSLAPGNGHSLPRSIRERLRLIGLSAVAAWATDLQGVRLVLPVAAAPEGPAVPEPDRSILILAQAIPEIGGGFGIAPSGIDGVCFAAAIRDHTREELRGAVDWLRVAGHTLLGFVAMGPIPASRRSPLERWEKISAPTPPAAAPQRASVAPPAPAALAPPPPAEPRPPAPLPLPGPSAPHGAPPPPPPPPPPPEGIARPAATAQTIPSAPAAPVAPPTVTPRAAEPQGISPASAEPIAPTEPPVPLVADWHRANRGRPRTWLLVLLAIVLLLAAASVWMRAQKIAPEDLPARLGLSRGGALLSRGLAALRLSGGDRGETAPESRSAAMPGSLEAVVEKGRAIEPSLWEEDSLSVGTSEPEGAGRDSGRAHGGPEPWESLSPLHPPTRPESTRALQDTISPRLPSLSETPRSSPIPDTVTKELTTSWQDTFVVHVSSFRRIEDADSEVARLRTAGVGARVLTVVLPERGRWHRVVVGAYPDSEAASREAEALRAGGLVSFTQTLGGGGRGTGRRVSTAR